jgi:hypothetical protein
MTINNRRSRSRQAFPRLASESLESRRLMAADCNLPIVPFQPEFDSPDIAEVRVDRIMRHDLQSVKADLVPAENALRFHGTVRSMIPHTGSLPAALPVIRNIDQVLANWDVNGVD